jgi:hypothetical protein
MSYKFDKPKEGESLSDYLVRHKAHPKLTPKSERLKLTDEEMKADGSLLPDDHPVYKDGYGVGLTRK